MPKLSPAASTPQSADLASRTRFRALRELLAIISRLSEFLGVARQGPWSPAPKPCRASAPSGATPRRPGVVGGAVTGRATSRASAREAIAGSPCRAYTWVPSRPLVSRDTGLGAVTGLPIEVETPLEVRPKRMLCEANATTGRCRPNHPPELVGVAAALPRKAGVIVSTLCLMSGLSA